MPPGEGVGSATTSSPPQGAITPAPATYSGFYSFDLY